jgi:hypothetical protein
MLWDSHDRSSALCGVRKDFLEGVSFELSPKTLPIKAGSSHRVLGFCQGLSEMQVQEEGNHGLSPEARIPISFFLSFSSCKRFWIILSNIYILSQVAECLPSTCKALRSNPGQEKKGRRGREEGRKEKEGRKKK